MDKSKKQTRLKYFATYFQALKDFQKSGNTLSIKKEMLPERFSMPLFRQHAVYLETEKNAFVSRRFFQAA